MSELDQTRAPLYEALLEMKDSRLVPFDVPGHKRGRGNPELAEFLGKDCLDVDVNSMKPLDNLCHPTSVIREAEELAADAAAFAQAAMQEDAEAASDDAGDDCAVNAGADTDADK